MLQWFQDGAVSGSIASSLLVGDSLGNQDLVLSRILLLFRICFRYTILWLIWEETYVADILALEQWPTVTDLVFFKRIERTTFIGERFCRCNPHQIFYIIFTPFSSTLNAYLKGVPASTSTTIFSKTSLATYAMGFFSNTLWAESLAKQFLTRYRFSVHSLALVLLRCQRASCLWCPQKFGKTLDGIYWRRIAEKVKSPTRSELKQRVNLISTSNHQ